MGWNSYGRNVLPIYIYVCVCVCVCVCACMCVLYMCMLFYMLYLLSSPYLLVIGDDRVRGTREQMMLMQVVLVRLSHERGILGDFSVYVFISLDL